MEAPLSAVGVRAGYRPTAVSSLGQWCLGSLGKEGSGWRPRLPTLPRRPWVVPGEGWAVGRGRPRCRALGLCPPSRWPCAGLSS